MYFALCYYNVKLCLDCAAFPGDLFPRPDLYDYLRRITAQILRALAYCIRTRVKILCIPWFLAVYVSATSPYAPFANIVMTITSHVVLMRVHAGGGWHS